MPKELSPEQLRWVCDPATLDFSTTQEVEPLEGLTGQERAVLALEFGLGMRRKGFNIYVAGQPGTGKMTAVETFLAELAKGRRTPPDYVYVNNFEDPYRPQAFPLPPGRGRLLREDMVALVTRVKDELPRAFDSEQYGTHRDAIQGELQQRREEYLSQINQDAANKGFAIMPSPAGMTIAPLKEGQPMTEQEFLQLDAENREYIHKKRESLETSLKVTLKKMQDLERQAAEGIEQLNREVALFIIGSKIEDLAEKYKDLPQVVAYFQAVQEDMIRNLQQFFIATTQADAHSDEPAPLGTQDHTFRKYMVNVLVDNSMREGLPVVVERNPTYNNLFGRIEREIYMGGTYTDFTLVRPGALHGANGGFLVIPVEDMLKSLFSYDTLKQALRRGEIVMEDLSERMGAVTMRSLQPQPIPLNLKVVLVGGSGVYNVLYQMDEDFRELFKIKADFTTQMDRTAQAITDYVGFIRALSEKEGIRPLTKLAVAKVVEEGARLAEDQRKLTTRFSEVADIIREADHHAELNGQTAINENHVQAAIDGRIYRSNLIQERLLEMTKDGTILVDTSGARLGQVNGLAVLSMGDYEFGRPSRITATVGLGQSGVLDIEREARLGGPTHTKGILILLGYLTQHYGQDKPLHLSARIAFEQSYDGVDGDSASSTELYALLSALSGAPIKQSLAVTGSINQYGDVQAIGGVNEKVEGFFDLCKLRGLTGEQGVLIPASNVQNLMLRRDVVQAVQDGKFHLYGVGNISEGIEVLTGVPAGERGPDGRYPAGTVHRLVNDRLQDIADRLRAYGRNGTGNQPEHTHDEPEVKKEFER